MQFCTKILAGLSYHKEDKSNKVIHFFKISNHETPTNINSIIERYNNHDVGYSLRNNNLRYPVPRTTSFEKSYFPATIDMWNNLDPRLANCTSLYLLKREINQRTNGPVNAHLIS